MYLEKRKIGKRTKYYLIHSYRDKGDVKKIRRYLGVDLSNGELEPARRKAEQDILSVLDELSTQIFLFQLSEQQIDKLNSYSKNIKVAHLDWKRFTENFVYNTNAIEGSSVERDEVQGILKKATTRNPDEKETKGVAEAVNYIRKTKEELSVALINKIHLICFRESKKFAGKIRTVEVVIRDRQGKIIHQGIPAAQLKHALKDLISWYHINKDKFRPLVLAAIIHNQFEHIHPFVDGNGRVGRLLMNYILLQKGYPPINISLQDRQEYYHTLQEYSANQDIKQTVRFLVKQYDKTLRQVTTKHFTKK